jgi:hypothetical protein
MFTRSNSDHYRTRMVAGLIIVASIAIGSLTYAVAHIQVVA